MPQLITSLDESATLLIPNINQKIAGLVKSQWFDVAYWKANNAVTGNAVGRNITWFVGHENDEWVLRHYYRGGLIAKLLGDRYLFQSLRSTRSYQELLLLETMYEQGLPVPKPIAAKVERKGIFYQADILIQKIPNAEDLVALLSHRTLQESEWHAIGAMIAKFHQAGIFHSDLNAHNILFDSNSKPWLIDFDKCGMKKPDKKWQGSNLDRLLRSFKKEKLINTDLNFDDGNWSSLLSGYQHFSHSDTTP